jgi:hypothetical protein
METRRNTGTNEISALSDVELDAVSAAAPRGMFNFKVVARASRVIMRTKMDRMALWSNLVIATSRKAAKYR